MGKTGKKVKSDKINILRKQYDAFLEEDKKRKQRNEFILGRLEDMRYSNKVPIPVHDQKISLRNDYYTIPQRSYISSSECVDYKHFKGGQSPLSTYNTNIEETPIFKELCRKYILIPKLRSCHQSDAIFADSQIKNITDTDWKNKYLILEELKKNEKETTVDNDNKITDLQKENTNILQEDVPLSTMHNESPLLNNFEKEHKRHQNENKIVLNISPENQHIIQNNIEHIKNPIDKIKSSELNLETYEKETKLHKEMCDFKEFSNESNVIVNTMINSTINDEGQTIDIKETKDYLQEKDQHNNLVNEINETPISSAQGDENLNIYEQTNEYGDFETNEIINENADIEEINNKFNEPNTSITVLTQEIEYQHEGKDLISNDTEVYKANEGHFNNKDLSDGEVGQVEENHELHSSREDNNENTQLNNEQVTYASENNDYTNVKSQISNEARNENDINEEYTYYDESHQEPYPREINEHEESSARYDPNYEQQYSNNYEDPNMAQYQNQHYEVENAYDQDTNNVAHDNQNVNDVNYEYGNPENVVITDQPQQENIYNYEDQINDNQHYDINVQQEYSVIQNEQYGYQQEYNESEVIEKTLDAESGLAEYINGDVNETVKTVNNIEKPSENIQSNVTMS